MRHENAAHLGIEEEDLCIKVGQLQIPTQNTYSRRLTEIPSVSNRVAAVATRETINLASSMREPFSSKAAEGITE